MAEKLCSVQRDLCGIHFCELILVLVLVCLTVLSSFHLTPLGIFILLVLQMFLSCLQFFVKQNEVPIKNKSWSSFL